MIFSVDFEEMSGKINHLILSKYLKDLGWKEFKTKRKNVRIFQKEENNNFFQVDIPTNRNLFDYNKAMYEAVKVIASTVNKSVEQVILELINPLSDILRVRVANADMESGNISMEDAINLYNNSKKLLMAAAMDIISPMPIHKGRPDDIVQQFLNDCRFGQTEIGSYVVSIVCPFAYINGDKYQQLSIFSENDICSNALTRKVSNKVISSIDTIKSSVEDDNLDSYVKSEDPNNSISINFLEALNNMSLYKANTELNITVKWAPTITKNRFVKNTVSLNHDYYQPIYSIIEKYKNSEDDEKPYTGKISQLQSNASVEKRKSGTVTLVYFTDDNNTSKATAVLNENDYDKAIEAHKEGKLVRITGKLTGSVRKKIENASFEILDV